MPETEWHTFNFTIPEWRTGNAFSAYSSADARNSGLRQTPVTVGPTYEETVQRILDWLGSNKIKKPKPGEQLLFKFVEE